MIIQIAINYMIYIYYAQVYYRYIKINYYDNNLFTNEHNYRNVLFNFITMRIKRKNCINNL